ncbi:MAG: Crp/Fnr family transcriptional regulator [SAR86 cluster bacterium]|uniref:Crp/Fnr family transcriptional regulator n=1 Tax=SAR86 cluster bacterium TaxID=2030880 RepID=A0A2A4X989_9GAMM|nr:MAG: Crp/Fnr family transcriptional regulator [SAR86 cluster bacterium]
MSQFWSANQTQTNSEGSRAILVANSVEKKSDIEAAKLATTGGKIPVRPSATVLKICPHNSAVSCASCRLSELCLPIALNKSEIHQLDAIVERNRPFKKGEHLYRQSDEFKSVYAVRSGSFKSYFLSDSGQGRVTGFYMPGEIIGMDGIASHKYANSTAALEHSSICEIPFSQLEKLSQELPSLQHHFFAIMGNEIAKDQQIHTLLSSYTAEERTASFLLGLSSRYARVSLSPTRFLLSMTRGDIGEYLGLTVETVSRIFTSLQKKGLISVNNREIELLNIENLREIISGS